MSHQAVHESEFTKNAVMKGQVLIVCSNATQMADISTGVWLAELAEPYYAFREAGYDVTIASPTGSTITIDAASKEGDFYTAEAKRFDQDDEATQELRKNVALSSIQDPAFYDIYFVPGGHGPMVDLATDKAFGELLSKAYAAGKVVAAVCHGPAGLVLAKDGDKPLVSGKRVTGFSNHEEEAVGKMEKVPFALETHLKELGGHYEAGPDWQPHVVTDGRLVTGQNPASSEGVATAALAALQATKK